MKPLQVPALIPVNLLRLLRLHPLVATALQHQPQRRFNVLRVLVVVIGQSRNLRCLPLAAGHYLDSFSYLPAAFAAFG